jgi:hypothetical protein
MQLKEQYEAEPAGVQIAREVDDGRIRVWPGILVDPFRPTADTVRIDSIAHSLSLVCRYAGHVDTHYSVAQHSLAVAAYLGGMGGSPALQLLGLLHDAEEAYFGDMSSPIKKRYPDYRKDGDYLRDFIFDKYVPGWRTFPRYYMEMVHKADQDLYQIERMSQLLPYEEARDLIEKKYGWGVIVHGTSHKEMESKFLREFTRLGDEERVPVEGRGPVSPKSHRPEY